MPVQYGGVLTEHAAVRGHVGVFDVSHLGRFEVSGRGATALLGSQLCNDIGRLEPWRAQYTMALNDQGGVEDDIIVWQLDEERFWVMPNGTTSERIIARFSSAALPGVSIKDVRPSTALLAIQGPDAPNVIKTVLGIAPGRFRVIETTFSRHRVIAAGTGYTGEAGGELAIPVEGAAELWDAVVDAGAIPAGLGARDTLRLEMGFPLWGQDLGPDISPLEAGLGWVVSWNHEFVGRGALEAQGGSLAKQLVAFSTEGRAIPRTGYDVAAGSSQGTVTSGNFSPTLQHGIGLAYLSPPPDEGAQITVTIRGATVEATRVTLPFLDR